jgi:CBS domain containing-hemolysin-like protein
LKENKGKKNNETIKWFIKVSIITFMLSLFFSYISTNAINDLNIVPAIFILLIVIVVGIIFDIIGVAVTVAGEEDFHAKASKKIPGAKTAVKLIRHSSIVANICADVIGDICGVLSGAISAIIAIKITEKYQISFPIQFLISAVVASLTVGGKALGKEFAKRNCERIVWVVSKIIRPLTFFTK